MKSVQLAILVVWSASILAAAASVPVIVSNATPSDIAALVKAGASIDGVQQGQVRAYVPREVLRSLQDKGMAIAIDEQLLARIEEFRTLGPKAAGYHLYKDVTNELAFYSRFYSNICRMVSVGKSVQNRDLWMLRISDNPGVEEDEPAFRYVSTMHGTEPVGMENCLKFIDLLLTNYNHDARLTRLVNECDLWIMPLMNPDGYVNGTYENASNVQLNRNFPDRATDSNNTVVGRAPETAALMRFGMSNMVTLSANFHGGALVVNYPYDGRADGLYYGDYVASPDDALFIALSRTYADANPRMRLSSGDSSYTNGICNGADWYEIYGGMQDWNYVWPRCFDVTIELDDDPMPNSSRLPALWAENRTSMLAYAEWCLRGVRGIVTDDFSGQPIEATIAVSNVAETVRADRVIGDYHRILLPGTYAVTYSADGYYPEAVSGIVVTTNDATRVDVGLTAVPEGGVGYWLCVISYLLFVNRSIIGKRESTT